MTTDYLRRAYVRAVTIEGFNTTTEAFENNAQTMQRAY